MHSPDPYSTPRSEPANPSASPQPPASRAQAITLFIATALGCVSGPFVFRAAGFTNFPESRLSHYFIIICYATGAITLSRLILLRLLALFSPAAKN